jgi:hypothetical protein
VCRLSEANPYRMNNAAGDYLGPYRNPKRVSPDGHQRSAENSNSDIMVMQSAEDCVEMDAPGSLNRALERRLLIQRATRSRCIIVGGIGA